MTGVAPPLVGGRQRTHRALHVRRRVNLLYLPAVAVFAVFTVYPLISGILISFTKWDGYSPQRAFVGIANYLHLFSDPLVGHALLNTFRSAHHIVLHRHARTQPCRRAYR